MRYQCWHVDVPMEIISASNSFEARKAFALKHNRRVLECMARVSTGNGDIDMRTTIASAVALALKEAYPGVTIKQTETTSGCPLVQFSIAGVPYNLTITRART